MTVILGLKEYMSMGLFISIFFRVGHGSIFVCI